GILAQGADVPAPRTFLSAGALDRHVQPRDASARGARAAVRQRHVGTDEERGQLTPGLGQQATQTLAVGAAEDDVGLGRLAEPSGLTFLLDRLADGGTHGEQAVEALGERFVAP